MAEKILNIRLRLKCDTEAYWASKNPVLLAGEMVISSDKNGQFKVGNGTSTWSQLAYNQVPWTSVTGRPSTMKNPSALTIQFNGVTNKTYDGSSAQTLNITPNAIGASPSTATRLLTATATASGWSASAPYSQTISVSGITSSDNPVIGLNLPTNTTAANEKLIKKAYGCLSSAVTNNGSITLYCAGKKPATDFTIFIKGV